MHSLGAVGYEPPLKQDCPSIGRLTIARAPPCCAAAGLPPTVHVYNALIAACDRGHQYERAMGIAREMSSAGVQPNAVTQQVSLGPGTGTSARGSKRA